MNCNNCHRPNLTRDDFYLQKRESTTLKNKKCKYCLREEANKKNRGRREYNNQFL